MRSLLLFILIFDLLRVVGEVIEDPNHFSLMILNLTDVEVKPLDLVFNSIVGQMKLSFSILVDSATSAEPISNVVSKGVS